MTGEHASCERKDGGTAQQPGNQKPGINVRLDPGQKPTTKVQRKDDRPYGQAWIEHSSNHAKDSRTPSERPARPTDGNWLRADRDHPDS